MQTTVATHVATQRAILVARQRATAVAKKSAVAQNATTAAANRAAAQPNVAIHARIAHAKHQAKPTSLYVPSIKVFAQN